MMPRPALATIATARTSSARLYWGHIIQQHALTSDPALLLRRQGILCVQPGATVPDGADRENLPPEKDRECREAVHDNRCSAVISYLGN